MEMRKQTKKSLLKLWGANYNIGGIIYLERKRKKVGKIMSVKDLTQEQLTQLKIQYLDNLLMEEENRNISYGKIVNINDLVSNDLIYNLYNIYTFVEEDFY